MLVIAAVIIGILVLQIVNLKQEEEAKKQSMKMAYVLTRDIKSGEPISEEDVKAMQVLVQNSPTDTNVSFTEESIAKINLTQGTILSAEMIVDSGEKITSDVRRQEYNMISLPIFLDVDDYIDVRLQFPDGQNYIVISKKRVVDVQENTVWLELTEEEITTMSNAIVEAYMVKGSYLYANLFVEAGLQEKATPTYPVSKAVLAKQLEDPNIVNEAKNALRTRYTQSQVDLRNNDINNVLNQYSETALQNLEEKIEKETATRTELRNKFLETLEE